MFSTQDDRFYDRMRRKTIKCLGNEDKQQEARRAGLIASERILKSCSFYSTHQGLPSLPSYDLSVDSSDHSESSERSSDRAVRRGGRRGLREGNEASSDFGEADSEFDITTITDAFTDFTTKNTDKSKIAKKKKGKGKGTIGWGRKKGVKDGESTLAGAEGDAWMCGVCGVAFSTLESAEKHEDQHLREVIQGLGWAGENPSNMAFLNSPASNMDVFKRPHSRSKTEEFRRKSLARARADSSDSLPEGQFPPEPFDFSPGTSPTRPGKKRPVFRRKTDSFALFAEAVMSDEEKVEESAEGRKPPPIPQELLNVASDFGDDLPEGTLVPKLRARTLSEVRFDEKVQSGSYDHFGFENLKQDQVLMSSTMRDYVVLSDEALVNVCLRAKPLILTNAEIRAERELSLLAKDKEHYDELAKRAVERKKNPSSRYRSDAENMLGKVQNKLLDAYQLMKEGDQMQGGTDEYTKKRTGDGKASFGINHTKQTLYVNVMVKNSVQVVKYELERLARQKWELPEQMDKYTRFERFRVYAHVNIVKLAGLALASDFTPRRIAIQLSNDLYRLLTPRLRRRGVTIGTEIEYRVGGYFVLAVNVNTIDWHRLLKANRQDLNTRRANWRKKHDEEAKESETKRPLVHIWEYLRRVFSLTKYDILAHAFLWLYYFHWIVYLPLCVIVYHFPLGPMIRHFIISSAIDDICFYVEQKGMEMEIQVCRAHSQASFMLSALREIRADGRELKKKRQETEAQEAGTIVGPLLGPAIKADKGPAVVPPVFEIPPNLEFVALELDLPVGFRRLRWAMLSHQSAFIREALYKSEARYEDITIGEWNKHHDQIGAVDSTGVDVADFIGAELEASYLMPKSAFVSANVCSETGFLIAYNDYCFSVKKRARTPDVPFGSTFLAWTQITIVNNGNDSCRMLCSVEAEFPNGPPMVSRQIQSGMRAGTGEFFVLMGATIAKYADRYP